MHSVNLSEIASRVHKRWRGSSERAFIFLSSRNWARRRLFFSVSSGRASLRNRWLIPLQIWSSSASSASGNRKKCRPIDRATTALFIRVATLQPARSTKNVRASRSWTGQTRSARLRSSAGGVPRLTRAAASSRKISRRATILDARNGAGASGSRGSGARHRARCCSTAQQRLSGYADHGRAYLTTRDGTVRCCCGQAGMDTAALFHARQSWAILETGSVNASCSRTHRNWRMVASSTCSGAIVSSVQYRANRMNMMRRLAWGMRMRSSSQT